MKYRETFIGFAGLVLTILPLSVAEASSLTVNSVNPGTTIYANSKITFTITTPDFYPQSYQLTDSRSPSSVIVSDIDPSGHFSWTPTVSDVGTHTLTITANDGSGTVETVAETITVMPPPSIAIQSVTPGSAIMAGTTLHFSAVPTGFTNPTYIVGDSFSPSTVGDANIDSSGNFSWTPDLSQNGNHTITVYASDSLGHSAQGTASVLVGPGPTLTIQTMPANATSSPGLPVSFSVLGTNFSPTSFSMSDTFPASTLSNSDINGNGAFYWTPQQSDIGLHVITITGVVGTFGTSASTTQTISVLGAGGTLPPAPVSTSAPTVSSSTAVAALQAQLAQLQATIAAQKGTADTPQSSTGAAFTRYLHPGVSGEDVSELQTILNNLGFLKDAPTGYYGSHTVNAVAAFQAAHGLAQLGVVGPATRSLLNSIALGGASNTVPTPVSSSFEEKMTYGQSDAGVLALQNKLVSLGFYTGLPSGKFDDATFAALVAFQSAHGIPPIDQLDAATRAALNK